MQKLKKHIKEYISLVETEKSNQNISVSDRTVLENMVWFWVLRKKIGLAYSVLSGNRIDRCTHKVLSV